VPTSVHSYRPPVQGTSTLPTRRPSQLAGVLPDYVPVNFVKPDFPAVSGPAGVSSPPAYLKWPAKQVRGITSTVASGSVTAMTPAFWPPTCSARTECTGRHQRRDPSHLDGGAELGR
jgi:hypothetical protein